MASRTVSVPAHIRCPICGRGDIRFSFRREVFDFIHKLLGKEAFRCLSCQARFHASLDPPRKK
jgi:hypothetical protein